MKTVRVLVPWRCGLHARPAARLVRALHALRARVCLRAGQRVADGRSILSVLALCAGFNTAIEIQASGEDAEQAIRIAENLFAEPAERETDLSNGARAESSQGLTEPDQT